MSTTPDLSEDAYERQYILNTTSNFAKDRWRTVEQVDCIGCSRPRKTPNPNTQVNVVRDSSTGPLASLALVLPQRKFDEKSTNFKRDTRNEQIEPPARIRSQRRY